MKLLVKLAAILAVSSPFSVAVKNINGVVCQSDGKKEFATIKKIKDTLKIKIFKVDSKEAIYFVTEDNAVYKNIKNQFFCDVIDDNILDLVELDGTIYLICEDGFIYKNNNEENFSFIKNRINIKNNNMLYKSLMKKSRKYFSGTENLKMIPYLNNCWYCQVDGTTFLYKTDTKAHQEECIMRDGVETIAFAGPNYNAPIPYLEEGNCNAIIYFQKIGEITKLIVNSYNKIYLVTKENKIFRIDDNEVVCIKEMNESIVDLVAGAKGNFYVATSAANVYKYNINNHDKNDFTMIKGIVGSIVKLAVDSEDNVYVATKEGNVYKSNGANDFTIFDQGFKNFKDLVVDSKNNVYLLADDKKKFHSAWERIIIGTIIGLATVGIVQYLK